MACGDMKDTWGQEERAALWKYIRQAVIEHSYPECFLVEPLAPCNGFYPKKEYLEMILEALKNGTHFSVMEAVEREREKWEEVRERLGQPKIDG